MTESAVSQSEQTEPATENTDTTPQPPSHIAIIMDGNGRWGERNDGSRIEGHRRAIQSLDAVINHAVDIELECLTLYCFSSDNLNRPLPEVSQLFWLFEEVLDEKIAELDKKNVRLVVAGDYEDLPPELADKFGEAIKRTADNDGLTLVLALMYSGREEITHAARELAKSIRDGELDPEDIDEETFAGELYQPDVPFPDLLIRTSGEKRLSDFLLWQLAYTELYFTDTLWPDFAPEDVDRAIEEYLGRERRYGRV